MSAASEDGHVVIVSTCSMSHDAFMVNMHVYMAPHVHLCKESLAITQYMLATYIGDSMRDFTPATALSNTCRALI